MNLPALQVQVYPLLENRCRDKSIGIKWTVKSEDQVLAVAGFTTGIPCRARKRGEGPPAFVPGIDFMVDDFRTKLLKAR